MKKYLLLVEPGWNNYVLLAGGSITYGPADWRRYYSLMLFVAGSGAGSW